MSDKAAHAEGFRFVVTVANDTVAYTTTQAEAQQEAARVGGQAFALSDVRKNPVSSEQDEVIRAAVQRLADLQEGMERIRDDTGFNNTDKNVGYALLEAWDEIVQNDEQFAGVASLLRKYKRQTTDEEKRVIEEVIRPFREARTTRARAKTEAGEDGEDTDEPIEKSLRDNVKKFRERQKAEQKAAEKLEKQRLARAVQVVWSADRPKTAWLFYSYDVGKNDVVKRSFPGKVDHGRTPSKGAHYGNNDFFWRVTKGTRNEWDCFKALIRERYKGVEVIDVEGTPDYVEANEKIDIRPVVKVRWRAPVLEAGQNRSYADFYYAYNDQISDLLYRVLRNRKWWDRDLRCQRTANMTTAEWHKISKEIDVLGFNIEQEGTPHLIEVPDVEVDFDVGKYRAIPGALKVIWEGASVRFVFARDDAVTKKLGAVAGSRLVKFNEPGTQFFLCWQVTSGITRGEWGDIRGAVVETNVPGQGDTKYRIEIEGEPKFISEAERPHDTVTVVWLQTQARFYFPASKNEILKKIIKHNFAKGRKKVLAGKDPERGFYFYVYGGSRVKWANFFKIAKEQADLDVVVEGTPLYDDADVPDVEDVDTVPVDALPMHVSMTWRQPKGKPPHTAGRQHLGGMYLLDAPHTDKTASVLGKNGAKWAWHKHECDAVWDMDKNVFIETWYRDKVNKDGKTEKEEVKSECVACGEQVDKGLWYTADPFRAGRLVAFADESAQAQLEYEQSRLDRAYYTMLESRTRAWPNFVGSVALRPALGAPKISVPPYFVDPKDRQRKALAYLPFQEASALQLADREATLLADEMGVGKTIQALALINHDPSIQKVLILAPLIALYNWQEECEKWLVRCNPASTPNAAQRFKIQVLADEWRGDIHSDTNIIIVNYDKIVTNKTLFAELMSKSFDLLVADEIHYCRLRADTAGDDEAANKVSKRCVKVFGWPAEGVEAERVGLVSRCKRRVFMTGTPIPNRPIELWPLLNHLIPGRFRDRRVYGEAFCDVHKFVIINKVKTPVPRNYKADKKKGNPPAQEAWGGAGRRDDQGVQIMSRTDAMQSLQAILRSFCMIRRLSVDVLDLPPKTRNVANLKPDKDIEEALQAELDALEQYGESSEPQVSASGDLIGDWQPDEDEEVSTVKKPSLDDAYARIGEQAQEIQAEMDSAPPGSPEWEALEKKRVGLMEKAGIPFKSISKTRKKMGNAKAGSAWQWIEYLLDNGKDKGTGKPIEKLVVFAYHTTVLDKLEHQARKKYQALGEHAVVRIDGQVKGAKKRQELKTAFQNDPNCKLFLGQVVAVSTAITLTAANNIVFVEQDWVPGTMQQAECRCWRIGQEKPVFVYMLVVNGSIDGNMAKALLDKIDVQASALNRTPKSKTVGEALAWIDEGKIELPGMESSIPDTLPALPAPVDDENLFTGEQFRPVKYERVETRTLQAQAPTPVRTSATRPAPTPVRTSPPRPAPTPVRTSPARGEPLVLTPPPVRTPAPLGASPRRAAVHEALRIIIAAGRPVQPLSQALARLPTFATDKQVDTVLPDVLRHRDVVSERLLSIIEAKRNPK